MDQPLVSPKHVVPPSDHKSNPKKSNNKQESTSKSKLRGQPSQIEEPNLATKESENKPKAIPEVNQPELTAEEAQQVKTNGKSNKRQSLKAKESAKISQRKKELEKDELKSATLKNVEASNKQIKTGNSKIQSNVRQYSAQNQRDDPPQPETNKVTTTESKKTKNATSENKAKTDIKQVREEVQKQSIIGAAKRSKRIATKENEPFKDHESDQDQNVNVSKKRKRKSEDDDFRPLSASNSQKGGRRSSLSSKAGKSKQKGNHEVQKTKQSTKKSAIKKVGGVSSKKSSETVQKQGKTKSKASKSALKSQAKSGVKKVKLDVQQQQ